MSVGQSHCKGFTFMMAHVRDIVPHSLSFISVITDFRASKKRPYIVIIFNKAIDQSEIISPDLK